MYILCHFKLFRYQLRKENEGPGVLWPALPEQGAGTQHSLLVLIQQVLLKSWGIILARASVTQYSRGGPAPLSPQLALARDLHTFLLEALKKYKKRPNSLLKVCLSRFKVSIQKCMTYCSVFNFTHVNRFSIKLAQIIWNNCHHHLW